jgi:hypothetical protein
VLKRRLGYRLGEVPSDFHRDMVSVGILVSLLYERMRSDQNLHKRVDRLVTIVELFIFARFLKNCRIFSIESFKWLSRTMERMARRR